MSDIRKPPLTTPHREGFCDWCDQPVPKKLKKNGEPYMYQPQWHRDCWSEYRCAMNPSLFFDDLVERDGLRCKRCGDAPHGWEPQKPPEISYYWDPATQKAWEYCRIEWRPLLDVDHVIPLWKVAHLPDVQRREYFKLPNLQLLCRGEAGGRCHLIKSAKEAAERAHHKNLCGETAKGRGEKPKRPIPAHVSPWPPKGSRKLESRPMKREARR